MTYEEKIRWLRRYQDSLRLQHELELEVERLRSNATRVTPLLSGMPGGQGDHQKLPRAVEQIEQAKRILDNQVIQCNNIRKKIIETIDQSKDFLEKLILRKKYILGQTFEEIAIDIEYSVRWCIEKHKRAITNLKINT